MKLDQVREYVRLAVLCTALFGFIIPSVSAEYLFTAPPRETPAQGEIIYGPLVKELSRLMNAPVTYQHPGNWRTYKNKVKSGEYDFIFDGPHFAAWRLVNLEVNPLVKLPGILSFVLVTNNTNDFINKSNDLITRKVCILPSPNLGTLSAYSLYPNQMRQPRFVSSKGGFKESFAKFKAGKCDAVLLRDSYFEKKLDQQTRMGLKVIAKTKALTNQGITISKRISVAKQVEIASFLTSAAGSKAANSLLNRLSKSNMSFITASKTDYDGQNLLVENMIFGW